MLETLSLQLNEALAVAYAIMTTANSDGLPNVAIAVVDITGKPLVQILMDGVKGQSGPTALAKALTALDYGHDTVEFNHRLVKDPPNRPTWAPKGRDGFTAADIAQATAINPRFCVWAGGVLVRTPDGVVIGAVGVSNRTELQDHELATVRD